MFTLATMSIGVATAQIQLQVNVSPIGMSDCQNAQLYGNVESITETKYSVDYSRHTIEKGQWTTSYTTTFTSNGSEKSVTLHNSDGSDVGKTITQFNENGTKRVTTQYTEAGERTTQMLYSYTADGLCASTRVTDAMAITMATSEISHGKDWASVTEVFAVSDRLSTTSVWKFEYNAEGRIIKQTVEMDGHVATSQVKLDANGHPKSVIGKTDNGEKSKFSYEYVVDSHKNWTERVEYIDGEPKWITYREIKYFED